MCNSCRDYFSWLPIAILVMLVVWFFPMPDKVSNIPDTITIEQVLEYEEGFSEVPYNDVGYVSIGHGHKITKVKGIKPSDITLTMSKEESMSRLTKKLKRIRVQLSTGKYGEVYNNLNKPRQLAIESMAYQLGIEGLYKFKKMWGALFLKCYEVAYNEALDSLWAMKQTPARALRQAEILRTGSLIEYKLELKL